MIRKGFVLGTVSILVVVFVYWGTSSGAKDCGGIPAEKVADMVHAVIESNRTFYTVHVPQYTKTTTSIDKVPNTKPFLIITHSPF